MRFYLVWFFCASLLFISCGEDKRNIPKDLIQEHAMAELLTDIHIVDGSLYDVPQQPDSLAKHGLGFYMAVFKAHNVDTGLFRKSLKFYTIRPDILSEIYSGVNRRLQKKIDSLQKIKPKIDVDSIRKAKIKYKTDSIMAIKVKAQVDSIRKATVKQQAKLSKKNKHKTKNALPVK